MDANQDPIDAIFEKVKLGLSFDGDLQIVVTMEDIITLENQLSKISYPKEGAVIGDELYLFLTGTTVLIVSKLEYFLKRTKCIRSHPEIPGVIKNCTNLCQLQKDHLIYLILIRHKIVHNGDHFDNKFFEKVREHIKILDVQVKKEEKSALAHLPPEELKLNLKIIKKLMVGLLLHKGKVVSQKDINTSGKKWAEQVMRQPYGLTEEEIKIVEGVFK